MKRVIVLLLVLLALGMVAGGCEEKQAAAADPPLETPEVASVHFGLSNATAVPTESETPAPTPEPVPSTVTIGAVGDIAIDSRLISLFYEEASDSFSFERAYQGMQELIDGVDLMCGNLETPLAGAEAGYSGDAKTPNAVKMKDDRPSYAFNAPDELAFDLKEMGFDFVSTANNHFSDRCFDGVLHTLEVLDRAGLLHAGTNRSEEERLAPRIVEINGIKIGLLASCRVFNSFYDISIRETPYLICSLADQARIEEDVRLCREAGAEFIIMFPHWDSQYQSKPSRGTQRQAEWLLSIGVDAILGSHAHVVQPIEFLTVQREDGPYTGLVVYCLGNSLMRMQEENRFAQLYVRLTIEKAEDGTVSLKEAAYIPAFSAYYDWEGVDYFEVLPAWSDTGLIGSMVPGNEDVAALARKARAHVMKICGTDAIPVMEDPAS